MAAADGLHAQEAAAQVEQRDRRRLRRPHRQPGARYMRFYGATSAFFHWGPIRALKVLAVQKVRLESSDEQALFHIARFFLSTG